MTKIQTRSSSPSMKIFALCHTTSRRMVSDVSVEPGSCIFRVVEGDQDVTKEWLLCKGNSRLGG